MEFRVLELIDRNIDQFLHTFEGCNRVAITAQQSVVYFDRGFDGDHELTYRESPCVALKKRSDNTGWQVLVSADINLADWVATLGETCVKDALEHFLCPALYLSFAQIEALQQILEYAPLKEVELGEVIRLYRNHWEEPVDGQLPKNLGVEELLRG